MRGRRRAAAPFTLFAFQDVITSVMAIVLLLALMLTLELAQRRPGRPEERTGDDGRELAAEIEALEADVAALEAALAAATARSARVASMTPGERRAAVAEKERELRTLAESAAAAEASAARAATAAERIAAALAESPEQQQLEALEARLAAAREGLAEVGEGNRRFISLQQADGKRPRVLDLARAAWRTAPGPELAPWTALASGSQAARLGALQRRLREFDPRRDYFYVVVRPSSAGDFREVRERIVAAGFALGFDVVGETEALEPPPGDMP